MRRATLVAGLSVALTGCGAIAPRLAPGPPPSRQRLAVGITEANPHLLAAGAQPAPFAPWRDALVALRPTYVRVFVDWAQSDGIVSAVRDGCMRGVRPCAAYDGLRDELRAIAGRRLRDPGRWRPVLTVYGVPAGLAQPPAGCERPGTTARSRMPTDAGLAAYRRLLRTILRLARAEGTPIAAVSPWNEPNHPWFLSPQRVVCDRDAPSVAPIAYARVVRAAVAEIDADPGHPALVLGELAGFADPTPHASSIAELVAGIPDALACRAAVWSVHDYPPAAGPPVDAVAALEQALAARPCTARTPVWVTETGAAPDAGDRADDDRRDGCRALALRLRAWDADPRVEAVFQYSFRDDPAFPVGLADAELTRPYAAARLWRAWAAAQPGAPPPGPDACG